MVRNLTIDRTTIDQLNFEEFVIIVKYNSWPISADFPFITYYLINKQNTDPVDFYNEVQCAALRKFDPRDLRYAASHTLDLFNEVATIARPPLEPPGVRPPIPSTGYIVSIFKVFEGDDGLKFEQNWLYWTGTLFIFLTVTFDRPCSVDDVVFHGIYILGARMMYRYLPKSVGLRRITLHKSMSQGDKMYLLICECSQLQDNLSAAAILLPALRARLCGYTGLYRPSVCFWFLRKRWPRADKVTTVQQNRITL